MQPTVHSADRQSIHQSVTEKIVTAIKAGASTFVMPWHRSRADIGRPTNAATSRAYQGINVVALWAQSTHRGFASGFWATFNQWQSLGAKIRRNERGTVVVLYKTIDRTDVQPLDDEGASVRRLARSFRLFNADQVDGWVPPAPPDRPLVELLTEAERFVSKTCARIIHGGEVACYRRHEDEILLPDPGLFTGSPTSTATEAYYATKLHELTHWSGASWRLNRAFGERFGDDAYAMEELVAELGSAFLCADLGIANEPRPDHAAYLTPWLKVLEHDPRAIFLAAKLAQDAVEFLASFEEPPF